MSQTMVNVGETVTGAVLGTGDIQTVYGSAYGTVINAGGTQIVALEEAHSAVDNTIVNDGGVLSIQSGMPTNVHLLDGGRYPFHYWILATRLTYSMTNRLVF